MMNRRIAVSVKDLNWQYGKEKLFKGLNLEIHQNRFYGIVGPNGSGKTTLLKNISRNLDPGAQKIFLIDKDIAAMKQKEISQYIALVPQNTQIEFEFPVMDIVLMGRTPYIKRFETESEADLRIAEDAMRQTNIWHLRNKGINEISGGELQRAIIARGLAQQAEVLLLDEPVSQLDLHYQVSIMELVRDLVHNQGKTAVAVMHDLNLTSAYCDEIVLMDRGKIAATGSPDTVLTYQNIERVYDVKVLVIEDPVTGRPHVIPFST